MGGLNPTEVDEACRLVIESARSGVTVILVEHVMKAIMKPRTAWSSSARGRRSRTPRRKVVKTRT